MNEDFNIMLPLTLGSFLFRVCNQSFVWISLAFHVYFMHPHLPPPPPQHFIPLSIITLPILHWKYKLWNSILCGFLWAAATFSLFEHRVNILSTNNVCYFLQYNNNILFNVP
jgi:hypothetical protein